MTSDRTDGAQARPAFGAGDLVRSLPDLGVRITAAETLAMLRSAALSPADVLGASSGRDARWRTAPLVSPSAGARTRSRSPRTCSTSTGTVRSPRPDGAMRPARAPGADGRANLAAAVATAASASSRERGVLVVFAHQVHAASGCASHARAGPRCSGPVVRAARSLSAGQVVYG